MRIYLITHPDTVVDRKKPIKKWKISQYGWKQVKKLAKRSFWREVRCIYVSSEQKAKLAGEFLAKTHKIPLSTVKGIEEIDRSSTEYLREKELRVNINTFYAEPAKSARGWETANHALERTIGAIASIIHTSVKKQYGCIAIVTHGVTANLYVARMKRVIPSVNSGQRKTGSLLIIDTDRNRISSGWRPY